ALVAFTGTLQFLPGIVATPYWQKANRTGLLAGLAGGLSIWCATMLFPLLGGEPPQALLTPLTAVLQTDQLWIAATTASLGLNAGLFIAISLLTRRGQEEKIAAEICSMDARARSIRQVLSVYNADDFSARLAQALGDKTAAYEVQRALNELQFPATEARPYALRRLRARLEANLSGLFGPTEAHRIIEGYIPFVSGEHTDGEDIHLIERNIDRAKPHFRGLAADLDNLRRHHRETLDKLPIGACSIGADGEVLMWNQSMQGITAIPPQEVIGSLSTSIPEPWGSALNSFSTGAADTAVKVEVVIDKDTSRWISLHKTNIDAESNSNTVIIVEDITDLEMLEGELLHNERLASIGRLAAGVAHEIGNPITGIACLAQNLEYEEDQSEIRQMAQDILKQTGRVSRIVESLMNFSHTGEHPGDATLQPTNLADCVDEAIHLLELDHVARPASFENRCDRELLVLADSQRLLQVFVNLLSNARDACDTSAEIRVSATVNGQQVSVDVDDNGCGIPQAMQNQVFEPFYTTKEPGAGTGLGLALVFSIMEDMNGRIQITSPLHRDAQRTPGTRMTLHLPHTQYGPHFDL
ncbi:MAG: PAS domain S-box protein, partial [Halioglobus sp.]|nr:PAS domain S-box protein [Halioglobus sp.]